VKLLGRREDVAELVKESDVLALLSEHEGTPNVVMEAQALGRPVVCTAVGGLPDIVQDGITGYLVEKDDKAKMVRRLVELLTSSELRSAMGAAAAARMAAEFSTEKLTARTLAAYGELAMSPVRTLDRRYDRRPQEASNY
jgi:glycosyltransferase involved in cell wall biosynthesis